MSEDRRDVRAKWPQIGDILPNHDGGKPLASQALIGTSLRLRGDVDVNIEFSKGECRWRRSDEELRLTYEAFPLAEQMFLIDAMPEMPDRRSFSIIADLRAMRALVIEARFPEPGAAQSPVLERLGRYGRQSAVDVRYLQGVLNEGDGARFERSTALAGKHLRYTYSSTHIYDHWYHSERFYSWFCRLGPDKGLGDFEECDVFELSRELYLVSWREKLLPCVGIMAEDHESMTMVGKICGANAYTGAIGNARVAATIALMADTSGH